ncbi:MAG: PQQ-binding-like beta-propeller repeat protein, partial [Acidobacteriota bacterium]
MTGISEGRGEFSHPDGFHLRQAWKIPIGSGSSAVVVSDGVVSTLFSDGENDVIAAFDADTGREKWRYPIEPVHRGHDGSFDGPASTPLIVDGTVIGLSARGRLLALQLATGE